MNILITGASKGVGYQSVVSFAAERSHRIFAVSRNISTLNELASHINKSENEIIFPMSYDISSENQTEEIYKRISAETDHIDVLINNAGLLITKPFADLDNSDWMKIFSTNVFGLVNMTRAVLPLLINGKLFIEKNIRSHVVNISSIGGIQGSIKFEGLSAYSSSKGAVITLTECLAGEFKDLGIYVNCLALGSVQTEMFGEAFPGLKAALTAERAGAFISDFALKSAVLFNGKTLPVSSSTP
jgi:NAD(P)-dependent dehydrogenase (short-subunit alcohol dehydrogenase family)